MRVTFSSFRLAKVCANEKALVRRFGPPAARKVLARLSDLKVADTLEDMRYYPGRCHEMTGDRSGELAIVLHGGLRLTLRPEGEVNKRSGGGLEWSSVTEVVDYHN